MDIRGPRIQGWAHDATAQRRITVEVLVDGVNVGSTVADRYRADLTSQCPDGHCAFEFTLPPHLTDGSLRSIEVRAQGTRRPLLGGRFTSHLLAADYFSGVIRWILRSGVWSMGASRANGAVEIDGWCIPPPGLDEGRITANGRAIDVTWSDGQGPWRSPLPPRTSIRTFTGRVPLDGAGEALHFSFGLERSFHPLRDFHYPLFDIDIPESERRRRVDGHGVEAGFNLGGYSTARKLDTIATRFAGRPLAGLGRVLDWGCGCGRVARFVARSGADLSGVDIDGENAAWCRDHIKGSFAGISPDPPTAFDSDFFDAIYGISVFTHLDPEYEKAWLEELHRIAKPGALLLLSIHGGMAAAVSGMAERVFAPEFAEGFVDFGHNPDIDAVTGGSTYYRNVFHQPGYIAKVWGRYFEILSIEEGIVDNMQDLVIARKPE